ncbi:hypothetical protein ABE28_009850 [Peribacillus muralis]|uniref:Uncharacterized protein n=1 Tax=Peribacillus muralis TaxID=264697 RepID=A0A1B3XN53_9BACI|nr:hypothetical protein ABE28_009850 [Peribacillus muralis]
MKKSHKDQITNFIAANEAGALCPALFMFPKVFYKENPEEGRINPNWVEKKEKKAELIPVGSEKRRRRPN